MGSRNTVSHCMVAQLTIPNRQGASWQMIVEVVSKLECLLKVACRIIVNVKSIEGT
jgi:hypothetical protein